MPFEPRFFTARGVAELHGRRVKRYHVNVDDRPIESVIVAAAYEILPRLIPRPDQTASGTTPPAAFAIVHRGRGGAAYALAYSWVWDNVVECHTAAAGVPFLGCPDDDPAHFVELANHWIGCVWELAPFEHERAAWVKHVLEPAAPDLDAYLADTFRDGPAGR